MALLWTMSSPADAESNNTSCIDELVHVDTGYINDSDYTQWVNVQLNGSGYAEIQLSPGESLGPLPVNVDITNGGEFIISVSNADDPYDGIQSIRVPFGSEDCSPTTTTTSSIPVPSVPDFEDGSIGSLAPPSSTTPVPVTKKIPAKPLVLAG